MWRLLFSLSIAVNAALLSFLAAAVFATYWVTPGEAQEGVGLTWAFTLPGTILVALAGALAHRTYVNTAGFRAAKLYLALVLGTSLLGPLVGYLALFALHTLHGSA